MAKISGRCHSSYLLCTATWMTYFFLRINTDFTLIQTKQPPKKLSSYNKNETDPLLTSKKNPKDNSRWWNTEKIIFTSRHTQWLLHPLTYIPAFSTTLTNHLQLHADWITLPPPLSCPQRYCTQGISLSDQLCRAGRRMLYLPPCSQSRHMHYSNFCSLM